MIFAPNLAQLDACSKLYGVGVRSTVLRDCQLIDAKELHPGLPRQQCVNPTSSCCAAPKGVFKGNCLRIIKQPTKENIAFIVKTFNNASPIPNLEFLEASASWGIVLDRWCLLTCRTTFSVMGEP